MSTWDILTASNESMSNYKFFRLTIFPVHVWVSSPFNLLDWVLLGSYKVMFGRFFWTFAIFNYLTTGFKYVPFIESDSFSKIFIPFC